MEYLPFPRHDDPDLEKYDLQPIIAHNLIIAKINLIEAKRTIKWLKITCIALLLALALAIGCGWAVYTTKQPSKSWQVKKLYFSFLAGNTYSAAIKTARPMPIKVR